MGRKKIECDIPDEQRCRHSAAQWRCRRPRLLPYCFCEYHRQVSKEQNEKRKKKSAMANISKSDQQSDQLAVANPIDLIPLQSVAGPANHIGLITLQSEEAGIPTMRTPSQSKEEADITKIAIPLKSAEILGITNVTNPSEKNSATNIAISQQSEEKTGMTNVAVPLESREKAGVTNRTLPLRFKEKVGITNVAIPLHSIPEEVGITTRSLSKSYKIKTPTVIPHKIAVPCEIFYLEDLTGILTTSTWKDFLTKEERDYLCSFLPQIGQGQCHDTVLESLLNGENINFGNPAKDWGERICRGEQHPEALVQKELELKECQSKYFKDLRTYHMGFISKVDEFELLYHGCNDDGERFRELLKRLSNKKRKMVD